MKEGTQESRSSQGPWKSQHSPEPLSVRTFWTPVLRGCQSTLQRNNNEALKRTQWRTNSRQMLLGPPHAHSPTAVLRESGRQTTHLYLRGLDSG